MEICGAWPRPAAEPRHRFRLLACETDRADPVCWTALLSVSACCYLEIRGDNAMSKLERAVQEAEQLPEELREKLGDDLLEVGEFVDVGPRRR